jgi:hypothetical protein
MVAFAIGSRTSENSVYEDFINGTSAITERQAATTLATDFLRAVRNPRTSEKPDKAKFAFWAFSEVHIQDPA